jgi:mannose/cellobiose epimerase-like protein (N-acyl-D-glucosamine 2-epimerase family)
VQDTSYARGGRDLVEITAGLAEEGWTAQATPVDGGSVRIESCGHDIPAGDLVVDSLHRVEGASDPGDMAVVVAVTCASCPERGVLVLKYGPDADIADADVLLALPDPPAPREPGEGSS